MIDKTTAHRLSEHLKIDLFTVYREYLQLLFLKNFYSLKETDRLFFKDGTALRLLFGSFRFSEDLDFTSLLSASKLEVMIQKTLVGLSQELESVWFKKLESLDSSFSGNVYQEIAGLKFPLTVRLDFSLREKPLLTNVSPIETPFPVGPYPLVSHLKIEEILAEKIRAILTRKRGRDLFDLYFILSKKVPIDWALVNQKMAYYKKQADLNQLIEAIRDFPQKDLENDLAKFLPASHRHLVLEVKKLVLEKLSI